VSVCLSVGRHLFLDAPRAEGARLPGQHLRTKGFHFAVLNGTGTAGTATYALAEPEGNGSGSAFGSGSNIKWNTKVKIVKKLKVR
jgi:hypothetical protein